MYFRDYYVIFERANQPLKWWNLLTHKDFAHVYLVTELDNKVMVLNMGMRYGVVEVLEEALPCFIAKIIKQDASVVLKYRANYRYHYHCAYRLGWNCVGMAKALLNIKGLQITPYQLYNKLRENSKIIHEDI